METTKTILTGKTFISVEEAEQIILSQQREFGTEILSIQNSLGRILAEDITADRDLPPYDRVIMDGITINYEAFKKGIRIFKIRGIQAAGENPIDIHAIDECIEIMTGAALPSSADTIIRYEDVIIENNEACIQTTSIKKGQNIHFKGRDKKKGEILVLKDQLVTPSIIGAAASVGKKELLVKRLPKCVFISTGNELVDVDQIPSPFQIRKSNSFCIEAVLKRYSIQPDIIHLPDDIRTLTKEISNCLHHYDVLLLSGGISMGKFDMVHKALEELSVKKLFHKVQQRPGKPFWFGTHEQTTVFAFPGNPVSAFLCVHRYFLTWLKASLGITNEDYFAQLDNDIEFNPSLTYFVQAKFSVTKDGRFVAQPIIGNGSGDFSSLVDADAFIELPSNKSFFKKGEVFRIWPIHKNYF